MSNPTALLVALAAVLSLSACSKPRQAAAPPAPDLAAEIDAIWERPVPAVASARPKTRPPTRTINPEAEAEARELAAEWERESEQARRIELLYELALNGTEAAGTQLEQLYRETTDLELKTHAIGALAFLASDDSALPLRLISDALATSQPPELRAAALTTLREVDSPVTLPIWQELLNDESTEVRELAQATIDYFAESPAP